MRKMTKFLVLPAALAMLAASQAPAAASGVIGVLMLADRYTKQEAEVARNTPGHTQWCQQKYPGYRPHINNYIKPDGRVQFCASPYYTPPWMRFGAQAAQ